MNFKNSIEVILGPRLYQNLSIVKTNVSVFRNRLFRSFRKSEKKQNEASHFLSFGEANAHTFFGYYDVTPFSSDGKRLLAMVTASIDHEKSARQGIQIGYYNLNDPKRFISVGQTQTWCWQMGCRLQWHPADPDRLILYNTMVDGSYGSVVQDVITKKIESRFAGPVYAVDNSGQRALSLNFSRLQRLRPGYGYRNLPDSTEGNQAPETDGIHRIDLEKNDSELIIDLRRLSNLEPSSSMKNADHYVNHLSFNPSGDRFMFFHLWEVNGQRYNRLMTSNWTGDDLCILEREGTASHYTWKNANELLATVHYKNAGTRYNLYSDRIGLKGVVGKGLLTKDGHPSYSPHGDELLTDTYPDKYREQNLLLLTGDNKLQKLASLYSPPRFRGETRCDLHPRWDREGKFVCVDETTKGRRKLGVLRIELL